MRAGADGNRIVLNLSPAVRRRDATLRHPTSWSLMKSRVLGLPIMRGEAKAIVLRDRLDGLRLSSPAALTPPASR